jgi:hypothetical protein
MLVVGCLVVALCYEIYHEAKRRHDEDAYVFWARITIIAFIVTIVSIATLP